MFVIIRLVNYNVLSVQPKATLFQCTRLLNYTFHFHTHNHKYQLMHRTNRIANLPSVKSSPELFQAFHYYKYLFDETPIICDIIFNSFPNG